jgi:hypothetical protein
MFGRRLRTCLPACSKLLDTPLAKPVHTALQRAKDQQAALYNRHAKDRPTMQPGQTVRIKYSGRLDDWRKGQIIETLPHRSYQVRLEDGSIRRRTSKHVRISSEKPIVINDQEDSLSSPALQPPRETTSAIPPVDAAASADVSVTETEQRPAVPAHQTCNQQPGPVDKSGTTAVTTRCGRVINKPARYRD